MSDFDTDMSTIGNYVAAVTENRGRVATAYLSAIDNFETTVQFASPAEAKADVLGVVLKAGLKEMEKATVKAIKESTGVELGVLVDTLRAVYDEVDRASKASASQKLGAWIRSTRSAVTNAFTHDQSGEALRRQVEREYNDNDEGGRGGYIGGIQNQIDALLQVEVPATQVLERSMYEAWINANFGGDCVDGTGVVTIQFDDDGEFSSATVVAPQADRIAGALNGLMGSAGLNNLMDLNVVKKVCKGSTCMCFEGDRSVRMSTDDADAEAFLTSQDNWAKAWQFR